MEDYKKKYEDALERAKDLHDNHALGMPFIYETCEQIFPELKESEDEKIRKEIINFINKTISFGVKNIDEEFSSKNCHDWIAWLEKQGKNEEIDEASYRTGIKRVLDNPESYGLEKQGEQKPIDLNTISIQKLVNVYRNTNEYDEDGNLKGKPVNCMIRAYEQGIMDILKTIKQKYVEPAWSAEDTEMMQYVIDSIDTNISYSNFTNIRIWMHSLKDRIQPKQEWSEEDEACANLILRELEQDKKDSLDYSRHFARLINRFTTRFKSLKPQNTWKPSDEQLEALDSATENCAYSEYQDCLRKLIVELKKLKREQL